MPTKDLEIDMDLARICEALKDLGVKEVILDLVYQKEEHLAEPVIEFRGQYGRGQFLIRAMNADFAIQGL